MPYDYEPKDGKLTYKIERSATYLPDFVLKDTNVILEVKGYLTSADRAKYIRVKASNPGADIRFVFDRASNRLSKSSKTTYADWATKNGFLWCEKIIPNDWYAKQRKTNARATLKATSTKGASSPRKVQPKPNGSVGRLRRLSTGR